MFSIPDFNVIVELGHPEQAPLSSRNTIPFWSLTKFISPPSWATAGLILSSSNSLILLTISWSFFVYFIFLVFDLGSEECVSIFYKNDR